MHNSRLLTSGFQKVFKGGPFYILVINLKGGDKMVRQKQKKITDFAEIAGSSILDDTEPIDTLLNTSFVITAVEFGETAVGKFAVVTTEDGKRYRTFSGVLLKQLAFIDSYLQDYEGEVDGVRVTLRKRKRYFTFE